MSGKRRGSGEGGITQRKDGRWQGSFLAENGVRRKKYVYGKTRKEVQEKLARAIYQEKQGTLTRGDARQTVQQFMEHWFVNVHKGAVREKTYLDHLSRAKNHIYPLLGHVRLQKLSVQHVQEWYATKCGKLAVSTVDLLYALLHTALETAVQWELVPRNVCDGVKKGKKVAREAVTLTLPQAEHLIHLAQDDHLDALIATAILTGMRLGELRGLKWSDLDTEHKILRVRRSITDLPGKGPVEVEPKTKTSKRDISLPAFLVDLLKAQRGHVLSLRLAAGERWHDHDLVFPSSVGTVQGTKALFTRWKALLKRTGLPDMRFHELRHSTATLLLGMGVHPHVVREILGHSDVKITLGTYSHVTAEMEREAMEKFGGQFR
ncbi:MAG TPA: tyrosine-type recombinase/integrase [Ktedonobacteraceae bacterium]|nr:tyrosine-type recombinase/integrase [Ktedonobacteraceae bacterium]